jgi:hypothetical protein
MAATEQERRRLIWLRLARLAEHRESSHGSLLAATTQAGRMPLGLAEETKHLWLMLELTSYLDVIIFLVNQES